MRINVIEADDLPDIFLRAEYREILMSCHYYKKSLNSKSGLNRSSIPQQYTLNKGHAKFFYDKMLFIQQRHDKLEQEMRIRGFKIRDSYDLKLDWIQEKDMNPYKVTEQDILLNLGRVLAKISLKEDGYYKLSKYPMSLDGWFVFYNDIYKFPVEVLAEAMKSDRFYIPRKEVA